MIHPPPPPFFGFFFLEMMHYWTNSWGRGCEDLLCVITVQLLQPYYRCPRIPTLLSLCFFFFLLRRLIFVHSELIFPPHGRVLLSLRGKKATLGPNGGREKKKCGILRKCSVHQRFLPLFAISGNWYLRPHFVPRPSLLEMSFFFLSAQKTAEAVEMELVVCRCMREWDYPGVMSALLNTITLLRSERDPKRIYCLPSWVWRCV